MENENKKKPFYKKVWFWIIVAVVIIVVAVASGGGETEPAKTGTDAETSEVEETITYEVVDLQTMLDELKNNSLKAEKTYSDKYVEVTGKISNFDSDGDYITIEPVGADEWNFETVNCRIKDDKQLDILLEKAVGDTVVIKGKITSIGEVLGYSLDVDEVN